MLHARLTTQLIRASTLVLAGSIAVHIMNYAFSVAMGRMLQPQEFGDAATLMAFVVLLTIPASAIALSIARSVAMKSNQLAYHSQSTPVSLKKFGFGWGLLATLIFTIAIPALQTLLAIDNIALLIFAPTITISLLTSVRRGVLHGMQEFGPFMLLSILDAGGKLFLSIAFVAAGLSIRGIALALLVTSILTYVVSLKISQSDHETSRLNVLQDSYYFRTVLIAITLLLVITNADVILAKTLLSELDAGQYAALATIGKIILYGAPVAGTAMFPITAITQAKNPRIAAKILHASLLITFGIALCLVALYILIPSTVVTILFGSAYSSITPFAGLMGIIATFWAASSIYVFYFLAHNQSKFLLSLLLAVIIEIAGIMAFHHSILNILSVLLLSSGFLFLAFTFIHLHENTNRAGSTI